MISTRTLSVALATLVAAAASLFAASGALAALEDDIRARLQSPASVCVVGEECAQGLKLPGAATGPLGPQEVYDSFCFACHATGANNSPLLGNVEQWAPRLEQGIDTLYQHAIEGFNNGAMPAKGTCMQCSDDEIRATVDLMVEAVQQ